jgi:hypothetical protein
MTATLPGELIYRVVTDMEGLQEAVRDRAEDLNTTRESLDEASGLQPGYCGKILCHPPMRALGPKSLPAILKATGMVMVLVIDDERFAPIRANLVAPKRIMRSIGRIRQPAWLFTPKKASKLAKNRWANVSPEKRKRLMKKLAKAGWISRRRKARKSVAKAECVAEVS